MWLSVRTAVVNLQLINISLLNQLKLAAAGCLPWVLAIYKLTVSFPPYAAFAGSLRQRQHSGKVQHARTTDLGRKAVVGSQSTDYCENLIAGCGTLKNRPCFVSWRSASAGSDRAVRLVGHRASRGGRLSQTVP